MIEVHIILGKENFKLRYPTENQFLQIDSSMIQQEEKMKYYNSTILAGIALGLFLVASPASAKVGGQCATCHTMHNSQGGAPMATDAAGAAQATPNDVLLRRGCVACHTGTNAGLLGGGATTIPFVNSTTAPNYGATGTEASTDTLAGGNFYWVAAGGVDAKGHNVATDGLTSLDSALGLVPPGSTAPLTAQLRCAGVNGCHGDTSATSDFAAMRGTHHADDTTIDGTTVGKSYRFLNGVLGLEDSDWEYQPTATSHNQYKGIDRTDESNQVGTISSLCANCHNEFHNGTGNVGGTNPTTGTFASPWVRHPTDFDMGNATGTEYVDYGGVGVNAYQVAAPVASADVSSVVSTVTFNDDTIVTCLSCHRAHGTPNDDLLRWDYNNIAIAGSGNTGACFACHTTKN